MSNEFESDLQPAVDANIIAYGDEDFNPCNDNDNEYDSDTSLSSTHSEKSVEMNKSEGNDDDNFIVHKKKSLVKILKNASKSKYSPMVINEEVLSSLEDLDHPPNDKKSFIWGAILMFIASFLFSISTTIIKWNHSFGRESFEIFVLVNLFIEVTLFMLKLILYFLLYYI